MEFKDKVLDDLVARIRALEAEVEARVAEQRAQFRYRVERNRIRFEHGVQAGHRVFRRGLWEQLRRSPIAFYLVSPFIYALIIPLSLLDLVLTVVLSHLRATRKNFDVNIRL